MSAACVTAHAVRRVFARSVRALDRVRAAGRSGRRVLVDVRTPMNLAVLRPVWKALQHDSRVTLHFVAEAEAAVLEALRPDGLERALIPARMARWSYWDLALTADAWNHAPLERCAKRLNFFHGVAGKYDLDNPTQLAAAALWRFDRMAFINAERLQRYVDAGAVNPSQAVLVGFPKTDDLFNGRWVRDEVLSALGLPPGRRTALYAPTFSTAGSLHLAGPAIIDTLLGCGLNVIVKLHDRSMVPHPRYTGGVDWPVRMERWRSFPRFAFVRDADVAPYLSAADVLVTDHSTVGFEFAALDRPVIVFDAPDLLTAARIDPDKWALLRSMATVVDTPAALAGALEQPDDGRTEARRRARDLFAFPGAATPRAIALVYDLLRCDSAASHAADPRSPAVAGRPAGQFP